MSDDSAQLTEKLQAHRHARPHTTALIWEWAEDAITLMDEAVAWIEQHATPPVGGDEIQRQANEVLNEIDKNWNAADPENDPESIVACLGDDATEMLYANPEDERAINMFRAAKWIERNASNSDEWGCGSAEDDHTQPPVSAGQDKGEPVAFITTSDWDYLMFDARNSARVFRSNIHPRDIPLYTAPPAARGVDEARDATRWKYVEQHSHPTMDGKYVCILYNKSGSPSESVDAALAPKEADRGD